MASSGKKKTTMAKLMRESRQRERRQDKLARKEARKLGLSVEPDGVDLNAAFQTGDNELVELAATSGARTTEGPDAV
jgi:hypothetical protein